MIQAGFQISVDPKGKKNQKYNLAYKSQFALNQHMKTKEQSSSNMIKQAINQKTMLLSLSGFKGIEDDTYIASSLKELQFAIGIDTSNNLNIEYRIPFTTIGIRSNEQDISMGIILLSVKMPSNGMPPMGGMPPPGMQPPSGMQPPEGEGMPPLSLNGDNDLFSEKKVWTKFITKSPIK